MGTLGGFAPPFGRLAKLGQDAIGATRKKGLGKCPAEGLGGGWGAGEAFAQQDPSVGASDQAQHF